MVFDKRKKKDVFKYRLTYKKLEIDRSSLFNNAKVVPLYPLHTRNLLVNTVVSSQPF